MLAKVILILLERIFVLLALAILRDSPVFVTQLVTILLVDTFVPVIIIVTVDFLYPWLRTVRMSVERSARLVLHVDDETDSA